MVSAGVAAGISAGVAAISAGVGIYSAVSAKNEADAGAAEAEKAARENALMIEAEGLEEERRARKENQDAQAEMRARSAASGVTSEGSPKIYMDDEQMAFENDIAWLQKSTASRAKQQRKQGKSEFDTLTARGNARLWGGIGSSVGQLGTAASAASSAWGK